MRRTQSVVLAGAAAVLAACWAVRWLRSPDFICRRALQGIQNRDARLLLSLSDEEQVRDLHLTEEGVRRALYGTVWREETPPVRVNRVPVSLDDVAKWHVEGYPRRFDIVVIDSPDRGWKLNLSLMLFTCCYAASRDDSYWDQWHALEMQTGILGTLDTGGQWYRLRDGSRLPAHGPGSPAFESGGR